MRTNIFIYIGSTFSLLFGQLTFTVNEISLNADASKDVFAVDMDKDGDIDVLSASDYDDKIAWYENNGKQSFSTHNIDTNADGANAVYALDLDNDGDIDVLSASDNHDRIAWYENDGSQSFTLHNIDTNADGAYDVYAIDLDNDGDIDVLSASDNHDRIAWYENDGSQTFTAHNIDTNADGAKSVYAIDLDKDGDMDVLSASDNDDKIAWYENNGIQSFTTHNINTNANEAYDVYAIDLDNDGDNDVLSASYKDNKIAWYENDGSQSFTTHNIDNDADGANEVYAIDLDKDGDMDVLSASYKDDKIAWYENDGSQSFTKINISVNADGANSVYAIDLDQDGDIDVLSASENDDKIAWYENILINDTPVIMAIRDTIINEDETYYDTLRATDKENNAIIYSIFSPTNDVTVFVADSILTLTPNANWHGVANIKVYASDGYSKDSTSFKLEVSPVQDAPTAFEWVSSVLDTINITQTNLNDIYILKWGTSTDTADGESITYLIYAGTGISPKEQIYDTTITSLLIPYQEFLQKTFEQIPILPRATVNFSVSATDGIDTVKITGDDRVVLVDRYEYLSIEMEGILAEFALHENYPNPFNPNTTLRFDLPYLSDITLTIYNTLGQKVKTFNIENKPAGYHSVIWDATNDYGDPVSAGLYLYQLQSKDFVKARKMILLK